MSKILNLTDFGKLEFKANTEKKSKTEAEVADFLQTIETTNYPTTYCFMDVNNPDGGDIPSPFNTYRLSMLTLPAKISYVNYSIDANNKLEMGKVAT